MMRTRIKICGITNQDDALDAVAAGADALGFNLYSASPRFIDHKCLNEMINVLPPFVKTVAVMVNPEIEEVRKVLEIVDLVQFHGDESGEFCSQFCRPYMKALRTIDATDIGMDMEQHRKASAILLDTKVDGSYGGTGKSLDWAAVPALDKPIVLAGGLRPENVAHAIDLVRPFAVDVSSGVEASKGIKDPVAVRAFVEAVRFADSERHGLHN
jgi:phosphoribosylanthranilate isomerase